MEGMKERKKEGSVEKKSTVIPKRDLSAQVFPDALLCESY